jgi:hypothetical protein
MARYYFHLRVNDRLLPDEEGCERDTDEAALSLASTYVRQMLGSDLADGKLDLSQEIIIADAGGHTVANIGFADTLRHAVRPARFLLHPIRTE